MASDLSEVEVPRTDLILHPKIRHSQVADLPQSPSSANANGSSGVSQDDEAKGEAQVIADGLKSEAF